METTPYTRKTFTIDAAQITEENFDEAVRWCRGTVETDEDGNRYIRVDVKFPTNDRQTKAYLTDWLLKSRNGFKIYDDRAFRSNFVKGESVTPQQTINIFEHKGDDLEELKVVDPRNAISGKR